MKPLVVVPKTVAKLTDSPISEADQTAIFALRLDPAELTSKFRATTSVFSDADGTILPEGVYEIPKQYLEYIDQLTRRGVTFTVVTGKPLAEVLRVYETVPLSVPLAFLCEKGAYQAVRRSDGEIEKQFVLSSSQDEQLVAQLRRDFLAETPALEAKLVGADGQPSVQFGWGGQGDHTSVLSIDIYSRGLPDDYMSLPNDVRDQLKLSDPELRRAAEKAIEQFVGQHHPDWHIVHMGNGNTEVAPSGIEKDKAIVQTSEFATAEIVQVWGDSFNDRAMFRLGVEHEKVLAGLVLHRETVKDLLGDVDFVSYGAANTEPFFQLLLSTHDA